MENINLVSQLQTIRELLEADIDETNVQQTCLIMNKILVIESKLSRNQTLYDKETSLLDVLIESSNTHYFK